MITGKVYKRINHYCIPLKQDDNAITFFYYYPDMDKKWKIQTIDNRLNYLKYYDFVGYVEEEVLAIARKKINARPKRAEGCQILIDYINEQRPENDKKSCTFGRYSY